jgi:hypothetical protein
VQAAAPVEMIILFGSYARGMLAWRQLATMLGADAVGELPATPDVNEEPE